MAAAAGTGVWPLDLRLTLPVYTGNNAELSRNYGLDAIPVSLLIGRDGKKLTKTVGGMTEKQLEAFLQPALK